MLSPVSRRVSIEYRKRSGAEFLAYWLEDADGYLKKVGPAQFKKSPLPDSTTDYVFGKMLILEVKEMQFNKQMDWNREHRELPRCLSNRYRYAAFQEFNR